MEKAKYIQDKENSLLNDLDKTYKKIKEISNWYSLSNYDLKSNDKENINLMIKRISNIYCQLDNLLLNTNNFELSKELKELITEGVTL